MSREGTARDTAPRYCSTKYLEEVVQIVLSTIQMGQDGTICFSTSSPSLSTYSISFETYYQEFADPHHFNAHPDPCLHFKTDPDPNLHIHADPDPDHAPYQSDANLHGLRTRRTDPSWLHFELPLLHCEVPRLHFEPLELPNLDFNADPCGFGSAILPNTIPICKLHHM